MRRGNSWAVWVLLAFVCAAAAKQDGPVAIFGTVTNSETGGPIERAHVVLVAPQQRSVGMTDGDGKFTVEGLAPGGYGIVVSHVGFLAGPGNQQATSINVTPGDQQQIHLQLTPGGAITGRVTNAVGAPMERARVQVMTGPVSGFEEAFSDEQGRFRIGGLWPGKYRVRAAAEEPALPQEIRADGSRQEHYLLTYFGGKAAPVGATLVNVRAGAEVGGVDIRLLAGPLLHIAGSLTGCPAGLDGVSVDAGRRFTNGYGGNGKKDGSFRVWNLDRGRYVLIGNCLVQGKTLRTAPEEIDVTDRSVENVELRVVGLSNISGSVVYAAGEPGPRSARRVGLTIVDPIFIPNRTVSVASDGSFAIGSVEAGRYRVSVSGAPVYVKSVRLGDRETVGDVVDLRGGNTRGLLMVTVSSGLASVGGVVREGRRTVENSPVLLVAGDGDEARVVRVVHTGKNGAYSLTNVAPGKYRLIAADPDDWGAIGGIGLDDYNASAVRVELKEHDAVKRDLRMVRR